MALFSFVLRFSSTDCSLSGGKPKKGGNVRSLRLTPLTLPLLLPQFYLAGAVNAQPSTAGGTPPDQAAAAEAAQPADEASEPTAPPRGKRAGEEEVVVTGSR